MAYRSLKAFLDRLEGAGELLLILEPVDPVLERAADKEYEEKLLKLIGERDAIVKRLMAARKRLSDAEAAGAPGEELAALSNAVKAVAHEIEVNRGKAQLTVRERINGQRAAK